MSDVVLVVSIPDLWVLPYYVKMRIIMMLYTDSIVLEKKELFLTQTSRCEQKSIIF